MDSQLPYSDPFDILDVDKLERVLLLLKEQEVVYFECGDLKIGWERPEAEKPAAGFVPIADRLGTQAAQADDQDSADVPPQYRKVFRGRLPGFNKKPKD